MIPGQRNPPPVPAQDEMHERAEFAPEITFLRAFERVEREMSVRDGRPMRPFRALRASMEALAAYNVSFMDKAFVTDVRALDADMKRRLLDGKHSMGEHEYVEPYLRVYKSLMLRKGLLSVERHRANFTRRFG